MIKRGATFISHSIMSNHVHMLIEHFAVDLVGHKGKNAKYPVTEIIRLLKGSTARECNLALQHSGHFWHHESYDHVVRTEDELERIIRYIINNPVKAGLVEQWKDWKYTYVNSEFGDW